jgi:hypothetical protein
LSDFIIGGNHTSIEAIAAREYGSADTGAQIHVPCRGRMGEGMKMGAEA